MRRNLNSFSRTSLKFSTLIWFIGIALSYGAISSAGEALRLYKSFPTEPNLSRVERSTTPLTAIELREFVQRLEALHPGVQIAAVETGNIRVSVSEASQYTEWRAAIADLMQMGSADTVFETVSICGASCEGMYCGAEFSAKKVRYAVVS